MSVEQCVKCVGLNSWARMGPVVPVGEPDRQLVLKEALVQLPSQRIDD